MIIINYFNHFCHSRNRVVSFLSNNQQITHLLRESSNFLRLIMIAEFSNQILVKFNDREIMQILKEHGKISDRNFQRIDSCLENLLVAISLEEGLNAVRQYMKIQICKEIEKCTGKLLPFQCPQHPQNRPAILKTKKVSQSNLKKTKRFHPYLPSEKRPAILKK